MSDKPMTFEEWERENFPDLKLAWIAAMQAGKDWEYRHHHDPEHECCVECQEERIRIQDAERERLTAPGPCGKHPAMFYHKHADSCFSKVPETEGNGSYLRCQTMPGCTLCAEISKVESERDNRLQTCAKFVERLEADNAALREALRSVKSYFWASGPGVLSEGEVQSLVEEALLAPPQPDEPKEKP
jgi:hypothetical protein